MWVSNCIYTQLYILNCIYRVCQNWCLTYLIWWYHIQKWSYYGLPFVPCVVCPSKIVVAILFEDLSDLLHPVVVDKRPQCWWLDGPPTPFHTVLKLEVWYTVSFKIAQSFSIGFKSGELPGHSFFCQNFGKLFRHHAWVKSAVWGGTSGYFRYSYFY